MLASLVLSLASVAAPADSPAQAGPSFVVVVLDDCSWEDLVQVELPTLQSLAPLGRVYGRFYSSAVCSPSRYQLHFGRYPHRAGIGLVLDTTSDAGAPTVDTSIAEALAHHGYRTAMFGKWHVNGTALTAAPAELPRIHGYQTWRAGSVGSIPASASHYGWERYDDGVRRFETDYSTDAIGDAFIDWWSKTPGSKLATVCFLAPHAPFETAPASLTPGQTFEGPGQRDEFESALVAIDTKLAYMAEALDLSNTYVFLTCDNGTPVGVLPPNPMEKGYKLTHFEGGVNVPLLVWGPGVAPGGDPSLVQIVDLPRTLLELAGAESPGLEDSISFAATLSGGAGAREHAFVHRFAPNGATTSLFGETWALVREDGFKLVAEGAPLALALPPVLYHLPTDPHETTPIDDPAVTAELLEARAAILPADWPNAY